MMMLLLLPQLSPSLLHTDYTLLHFKHVVVLNVCTLHKLDHHQSLFRKHIAAAISIDWANVFEQKAEKKLFSNSAFTSVM